MNNYYKIVLFIVCIFIISCENEAQQELVVLYEEAKGAYVDKNYEEAFEMAHRCSVLAEERENAKQLGNALNLLGATSRKQKKDPEALRFYLKAIDIKEILGDSISMSNVYNNIGNIYYLNEAYEEALRYHTKATKIREKFNDSTLLQNSHRNTALAYKENGQYQEAIHYFSKSIAINGAQGNEKVKAYNLNDIGICHKNLKEYANALEYYHKTLELWKRQENINGIAKVNNNLAVVYYNMDSLVLATNYADQCIALGMEELQIYTYNTLCDIYVKQEQTDKVIEYAKKAISLGEKYGTPQELLKAYKHAMGSYFKLKDLDKGALYSEKVIELQQAMHDQREVFYKIALAQRDEFKAIEIAHYVNKATLANTKKWSVKQSYWFMAMFGLVVAFVVAGTTFFKKHRDLKYVAATFPAEVQKSLAEIGGISFFAKQFPEDGLKKLEKVDLMVDNMGHQIASFTNRVKNGIYAPERFDPGIEINGILDNYESLAQAKKTSILKDVKKGHFINIHKKTYLCAVEILLRDSLTNARRETMVTVEVNAFNNALWVTITGHRPHKKSYIEDPSILKELKAMGGTVSMAPQIYGLFEITIAFDLA